MYKYRCEYMNTLGEVIAVWDVSASGHCDATAASWAIMDRIALPPGLLEIRLGAVRVFASAMSEGTA